MKIKNTSRPIFLIFLVIFFFAFGISFPSWAKEGNVQIDDIGSSAEWLPARTILMHVPGEEVFLGVIHPAAALFEKPFGIRKAASQLEHYIELLQSQGAVVHTVEKALLKGTVDASGRTIPGSELEKLQEFARDFLTIDSSNLPSSARVDQEKYKLETIAQLSPYELVQVILLRPTVRLFETHTNTGFRAQYELAPVMNLYFCRDQMITTAKGVVISRMNSEQRRIETKIIKFALEKLGIKPIYEVSGQGLLEGGDYFTAGDIAFIGQGLRTNAEGVKQLLDHKVFGTPKVAVVKDEWKNQEEMHLDTYFNIINPQLAVLIDMRMNLPGKPIVEGMATKVDVYELIQGVYEKKISDRDFQEYLEKDLGYTLIPISRSDQNLYGINFLTIRPNRILGINGVSQEYKDTIKKHGVDATWMDFSALTSGYGAAHCTTQVLSRGTELPGR